MIGVIVARNQNNVIGVDGKVPWRIPADLRHFKELTLGHPVVMGRKTFESLPFPLPFRENWVLSRSMHSHLSRVRTFNSLHNLLVQCKKSFVWCAGGGEVYEQMLPHAELVVATTVLKNDISEGVKFPEFDETKWAPVHSRMLTETAYATWFVRIHPN